MKTNKSSVATGRLTGVHEDLGWDVPGDAQTPDIPGYADNVGRKTEAA